MNVSTKSEYGLRALIYLAGNSERDSVPAREIAEKWHVPVKYLEQILKTLKDNHIILSQVGTGGGYRLSRPATLITAGEVIRILDGRLSHMGCVSSYDYEPCEFEAACGLKTLWARARAALVGVLDQTTIADLCTPANHRSGQSGQTVVSLTSSSKR
jgi:Rrf2 family protein